MKRGALAVVLLAAALVSGNSSSCGSIQPSTVKDCNSRDIGSCGNACCAVDVTLTATPEKAYTVLKSNLSSGGKDRSFAYINDTDTAGHNPVDNLTPFHVGYNYILQGTHTTTSGYVDTININIKGASGATTQARLFSISNIHGALGDNGQNFKSLAFLLQTSGLEIGPMDVVHGCGGKSAT